MRDATRTNSSTETSIKSTQTEIGISRRQVKTVTYAFLYGAGDAKIGHSFDSSLNDRNAKSKGKEIREAFVSAIDGLAELLAAIKTASEKGFIRSIDKERLILIAPHKALNYLLQSGAGVSQTVDAD